MKKIVKKKSRSYDFTLKPGESKTIAVHPDGKVKEVPAPVEDPAIIYAELMQSPARYFTVAELGYLLNSSAAIDSIRLKEIRKNRDARKAKLTKA